MRLDTAPPPTRTATPWPSRPPPHPSRQGDGIGVDSLTERERQVARLVVDRRTNPEIAEALFLSPKTVQTHMRNIFRKLHVSSRADVARTVERARHHELI